MRASGVKRTYLRNGTYQIGSTIWLGGRDTGVRFNSFPCERAALDGGERLTNWTSVGNQVYKTVVNSAVSYYDLSAFNTRQRVATSAPYDGNQPYTSTWLYTKGNVLDASGQIRMDAFQFDPTQLNRADFPYLTGMVAQNFGWSRQSDSSNAIKNIDWNNGIIYLYGKLSEKPGGGTFRILNNYRWLRESGEFAWEWGDTKTLYTKQSNPDFMNSIVMPRLGAIFHIEGGSDIQILNLSFQNTISRGKAIEVVDSTNIGLGGNDFKIVGTAISLQNTSSSLIAGNTMSQLGSSGIECQFGCNKNKIYANKIRNPGQVYKYVSGIALAGASDTIVAQNDVSYSSRYGVSHKDWSKDTINWRNRIESNWIFSSCLETGDCGGIEAIGRQMNNTGTVIRNNVVDTYAGLGGTPMYRGFKGFGIFIDDLASGMTIEKNVIKQTGYTWSLVYVHGGDNNTIINNFGIADHNDNKFLRIEHTFFGNDASGKPTYKKPMGTVVRKNIIYYKDYNPDWAFYISGGDPQVDENLLVNTGRFYEDGKTQDANSIQTTVSPFVDVSKNDWRLQPNSEASKLGITDLDWGKVGAGKYAPTAELPRFW